MAWGRYFQSFIMEDHDLVTLHNQIINTKDADDMALHQGITGHCLDLFSWNILAVGWEGLKPLTENIYTILRLALWIVSGAFPHTLKLVCSVNLLMSEGKSLLKNMTHIVEYIISL